MSGSPGMSLRLRSTHSAGDPAGAGAANPRSVAGTVPRVTNAAADDLALARTLADAADTITLTRFGAVDLLVETKPDLTLVSDADRAVEQSLRARIAESRPGDAVWGEEYGRAGGSPRQWVVDPIDGTHNFV